MLKANMKIRKFILVLGSMVFAMTALAMEEEIPNEQGFLIQEKEEGKVLEQKETLYIRSLLTNIHQILDTELGVDRSNQDIALSWLSGLADKTNAKENKELRDRIRLTLQKGRIPGAFQERDVVNLRALRQALLQENPRIIRAYLGFSETNFTTIDSKEVVQIIEQAIEILSSLQQGGESPEDLLTIDDLPLILNGSNLKNAASAEEFNKEIALLNKLVTSHFPEKTLQLLPPFNNSPNLFAAYKNLMSRAQEFKLKRSDFIDIINNLNFLNQAIGGYNPAMHGKSNEETEVLILLLEQFHKISEKVRTRVLAYKYRSEGPNPDLDAVISFLQQRNEYNQRKILDLVSKEEIWVLSLDGGGIKGILGATMLDEVANRTGKRITDMFDFFAGTSTGGLIALGLTASNPKNPEEPLYDTSFVKDLYLRYGEQIFPPILKGSYFGSGVKQVYQAWSHAYSPDAIESLLISFFGMQPLSDVVKPTLVTAVNITDGEAMLFASYKAYSRGGLNFLPHRNPRIWQAGRATSAAPTYFPPITMYYDNAPKELIDGGVTTNNPTLLALREIRTLCQDFSNKCNIKKINVVSIGTGIPKYKHKFGQSQLGLLNVLEAFTEVGMGFGVRQTEFHVKEYLDLGKAKGDFTYNYYRFNPNVGDIELDSASKENIDKLSTLSQAVISRQEFKKLLNHLNARNPEEINGQVVELIGELR